MTFRLEGDANDYVGKGLSGGRIMVLSVTGCDLRARGEHHHRNVALYGATAGEAYFRGMAGERFAVRNSGVRTVVEGVGDHGCEYMTGGRVVVLGPTGRNFAAACPVGWRTCWMRPATAAAASTSRWWRSRTWRMRGTSPELHDLIEQHWQHTRSANARRLLDSWATSARKFVKVLPRDYQRVLACIRKAHDQGLTGDEAIMAAFEENTRDLARVGGN